MSLAKALFHKPSCRRHIGVFSEHLQKVCTNRADAVRHIIALNLKRQAWRNWWHGLSTEERERLILEDRFRASGSLLTSTELEIVAHFDKIYR